MTSSNLVTTDDLEEAWLCGDTDRGLLEFRPLAERLRRGELESGEVLRAQILCSRLYLVAMDKAAAEEILADYVSRPSPESRLIVHDDALAGVTPAGPLRAQLYSQVANLLFQCFDYENGERVAKMARAECNSVRSGVDSASLTVLLTHAEAETWWSRLAWQVNDQKAPAKSVLVTLKDRLADARDREKNFGGIDLALAIVAILLAAYEQAQGQLSDARVRVHQAMYLLSSNAKGCHDRVRFGYATYELATTEATTGETTHFRWPIRLFEDVDLHLDANHPIRWRAQNRLAQCHVRIGESVRAQTILNELESTIAVPMGKTLAPDDERNYIAAEVALSHIWLAERRARDSSSYSWNECLKLARAQADSPSLSFLPLRVRTEVAQHYGLALAHCDQLAEARRQLADARSMANRMKRTRVTVATLFASAECELRGNDRDKALEHFNAGVRSLGLERSLFLEEWRDRLSSELDRGFHLTISDDTPYQTAIEEFHQAYTEYHMKRVENGDIEGFLRRTKIPRSTWFRWIRDEKKKSNPSS